MEIINLTTVIFISAIALLSIVIFFLLRVKAHFFITHEWSCPYAITTVNNSSEKATVELFGQSRNLLRDNFGSDKNVAVYPQQVNVRYLELLQQSSSEPFETRLIRLFGKIRYIKELTLNIECRDANGQQCNIPIFVQAYMKEYTEEEMDSDGVVDIPYLMKINHGVLIRYQLQPDSQIDWHIYYNTKEFKALRLLKYLFCKKIIAK